MKIYWDTMIFIYLLEGSEEYGEQVQSLYTRMTKGNHQLITSTFTLGEILVLGYKQARMSYIQPVRELFSSGEIQVVPFTVGVAERFAQLRAEFDQESPDTIHLATASENSVDFFVTNDLKLQKLRIPEIGRIAGIRAVTALL